MITQNDFLRFTRMGPRNYQFAGIITVSRSLAVGLVVLLALLNSYLISRRLEFADCVNN
jgi:hypothetical protein